MDQCLDAIAHAAGELDDEPSILDPLEVRRHRAELNRGGLHDDGDVTGGKLVRPVRLGSREAGRRERGD